MTELNKTTQLAWRRFLASDAGIKGLLWLRESEPRIRKGDTSEMIHDGGVVSGYRLAIDALSDVVGREEEKPVDIENR